MFENYSIFHFKLKSLTYNFTQASYFDTSMEWLTLLTSLVVSNESDVCLCAVYELLGWKNSVESSIFVCLFVCWFFKVDFVLSWMLSLFALNRNSLFSEYKIWLLPTLRLVEWQPLTRTKVSTLWYFIISKVKILDNWDDFQWDLTQNDFFKNFARLSFFILSKYTKLFCHWFFVSGNGSKFFSIENRTGIITTNQQLVSVGVASYAVVRHVTSHNHSLTTKKTVVWRDEPALEAYSPGE